MENQTHQTGTTETFTRRSGSLISAEYKELGRIENKVKVLIVKYKDLISEQSEFAIRFEYEHYNTYSEYSDIKIGSLDADELDGLVKSIRLLRNSVFQTYPAHYTEVNFRSRSGFVAGAYYENEWKFYLKISEFDNDSNVFLKREDATQLLELLLNQNQIRIG